MQGTPESVNVGAMIVNEGPDWITDYTWIRYVGVDWANSQLYLLEAPQGTTGGHLREARVHVLTIGEAPAPIPEPAGLGLVGLALLVIRKRRS